MKKILLVTLLAALIAVPVPIDTRTNASPDYNKHHALLRLEDVGPGGSYATLEDLGKLRAVFEYLETADVPFQVAAIPREIFIQPDGTRYEKGIDDPNPDESVQKLIKLMQSAEQKGAVIGMHGYTHQYGDKTRPDNNQDSGVGNEFHVKDAPETDTPEYAADKITKSLAAFDRAGWTPGFWESPHYNDTREQEELFRSYVGILHQPDWRSLRTFKDLTMYEDLNTYGSNTTGSVYVPAPLRWVYEDNTVDDILSKLDIYEHLASVFYHPFLEFASMEPVQDASGATVMRDGLPEYRYKSDTQSDLHRLVDGMRDREFRFMSLYDIVPFSPAHRIDLPLATKEQNLLLGDLSGDGGAELVVREHDRIDVFSGNYDWPRNRPQRSAREWLKHSFTADETLTLADVNGDKLQDLLAYNKQTGVLTTYLSNGNDLVSGVPAGTVPAGYSTLDAGDANGDGKQDLFFRQNGEVWLALNQQGKYQAPQKVLTLPEQAQFAPADLTGDKQVELVTYSPDEQHVQVYLNEGKGTFTAAPAVTPVPQPDADGQLLVGDTNGDGLSDVIICDADAGIWQVFQSHGPDGLQPIDNLYGPWARGERTALAADFDGNGKTDIASFDSSLHALDLSLSFRDGKPRR